ncbi:MAG: hypothetical protein SGI98_11745 [Verrucomicrobiota bacterium]|nr:hypothetical protein [Verrucomicrobiota bacterium]
MNKLGGELLWSYLHSRLWFLPLLIVAVSILLTVVFDRMIFIASDSTAHESISTSGTRQFLRGL